MAKIRHIALASAHPGKAAAFFKEAFGFRELGRFGLDPDKPDEAPRPCGVFLTDGTINFALLKLGKANLAGVSEDFIGIHHFGVVVDDMDAQAEKLAAMGALLMTGYDAIPPGGHKEIKFLGPDGVIFDITDKFWSGTVEAGLSEAAE